MRPKGRPHLVRSRRLQRMPLSLPSSRRLNTSRPSMAAATTAGEPGVRESACGSQDEVIRADQVVYEPRPRFQEDLLESSAGPVVVSLAGVCHREVPVVAAEQPACLEPPASTAALISGRKNLCRESSAGRVHADQLVLPVLPHPDGQRLAVDAAHAVGPGVPGRHADQPVRPQAGRAVSLEVRCAGCLRGYFRNAAATSCARSPSLPSLTSMPARTKASNVASALL